MRAITQCLRAALVGSLVASLTVPVAPVFAAGASLGTARGVLAADLSLDGGQRWLRLADRALPVMDASRIRTTGGGVMLDLVDGSRVNVLPYSSVAIRETAAGTTIALAYGRLTFRLPPTTRVAIETPAARLEAVRAEEMAGEVFASSTTGLKMTRGRLEVRPRGSAEPVMVASVDPVFFPERPTATLPLFTTEASEVAAPAGARGLFGARGESLGYLSADGRFVVEPGFTADLASPFAPRTVQVALAQIPQAQRAGAEPLFDVNGAYVGFVAGPEFFAQAAPSASGGVAAAAGAGGAGLGGTLVGVGSVVGITGAGVAAHATRGRNRGCGVPAGIPPGPPATPVGPC